MPGRFLARRPLVLAAMTVGVLLVSACKSSTAGGGGGGPVAGPADVHCVGVAPQPVIQADCTVTSLPDAGAGGSGPEYGPTMYGSEGDDDDCKYHVTWKSTAIAENQPVTFTVTGVFLTNGTPDPPKCTDCPVTGANTLAEVYLNDTHPAPNTNPPQATTESPPGTYIITPIVFDAPGTWTVRFHFNEQCADVAAGSPHGHAAFFVDVP
jgi:hypothetical protein